MAADPFAIVDAVREQIKLRMLIDGVSGSGKTATALLFATALARRYGGKIGLLATEQNRDLAYVGTRFAPDGYQRIVLSGTKSVANYRAALNRFKNLKFMSCFPIIGNHLRSWLIFVLAIRLILGVGIFSCDWLAFCHAFPSAAY